MTRNEITK